MSNRSFEDPTMRDVVRIVRRHKKKVALFSAVVIMCAFELAVILPAKYASESKLLMLIGRESVTLDPVASTGQVISIDASREVEMKSVRDLMKSREVLSKVVEQLGADVVLRPPENPGVYDHAKRFVMESKDGLKSLVKGWFAVDQVAAGGVGASAIRNEEAIKALQGSITISGSKESSVISVMAEARSPDMAQTLASTLVDAYIRQHAHLHTTAGSEEFFREQKQLIEDQLLDKRTRLGDLKTEMGIGSVEAEFDRLEEAKSGIATLRDSLAREAAGAMARCAALEQAIASEEEVVLTERNEGMENAATEGIRQQLYELEIVEGKASHVYTTNHPRLEALRQQLDQMRKSFAGEEEDRTEVKFGRNAAREALALDLEQEQSKSAEVKAQIKVVNEQWENVLASLEQLNRKSSELEQLSQDVAFLVRSYDTYSDSLEQSRIGSSLNSQMISNINVAQPAPLVTEPIGPNRILILASGLLFAMLGSIPLAFVMEHLDGRMKSPVEVEAVLGTPVMATIPKQAAPLKIPKVSRSTQNVG